MGSIGWGELLGILGASVIIALGAWYFNFGVGEGRHKDRDERDKR